MNPRSKTDLGCSNGQNLMLDVILLFEVFYVFIEFLLRTLLLPTKVSNDDNTYFIRNNSCTYTVTNNDKSIHHFDFRFFLRFSPNLNLDNGTVDPLFDQSKLL